MSYQFGSTAQSPKSDVGVAAALVAERGVGFQAVAFRSFADADGVEIGAFDKDIFSIHGDARFLSAEDTGDTHALFLVANHQIAAIQATFLAVEGDKRSVLRQATHMNLVAGDHVGVEGMERLTDLHKDKVGDVDDVVDGAKADGAEFVLEPVG